MPIDPAEWLTVAEQLVTDPNASETDLRRGVSIAYYAVFHHLLKTATERLLGTSRDVSYETFYRSFRHPKMKSICDLLDEPQLKPHQAAALGFTQPSEDVRIFAGGFTALQQARHEADYNPTTTQSPADSSSFVQLAGNTIFAFQRIPPQHQNAILLYMLMEIPRRS